MIYFIDFANKTVMGSASKHHNNMRRSGLCNVKYYFNNSNSGVSPEKANKTISVYTVKILKIGTPVIITIIVLQLEQLDFTVQYCV